MLPRRGFSGGLGDAGQIGPEEDSDYRCVERGVGPVIEVPSNLFASIVHEGRWMKPDFRDASDARAEYGKGGPDASLGFAVLCVLCALSGSESVQPPRTRRTLSLKLARDEAGLSRMALEEADDAGQRFERKLVAAGMNVGHKLRAGHSGLCSLKPSTLAFDSSVFKQLARRLDAVLLSLKRNERVFFAGDDEYRLRCALLDQSAAGTRRRAQRR